MEQFINFILELVDDEFYQYLDSFPAQYYFLNGGCIEFAKILKYYYPDGTFVIDQNKDHVAFLYENIIYDATGIIKEGNWKLLKSLESIENTFGNNEIKFENKAPHIAIIDEISQINSSYIKKILKVTTK